MQKQRGIHPDLQRKKSKNADFYLKLEIVIDFKCIITLKKKKKQYFSYENGIDTHGYSWVLSHMGHSINP